MGDRVYMPPMEEDPYRIRATGERSQKTMIVAIVGVVLVALGAVAWNFYGASGPTPVISADASFKTVAPAPPATPEETRDVYNMIEAAGGAPAALHTASPEAAPAAVNEPPAEPASASGGAYVVQLAALRTPEAAQAEWTKIADANPALLRGVRRDVQRADLGAQGIYYRLRAGYFDGRAEAAAFCERMKGAGLACMVVVR